VASVQQLMLGLIAVVHAAIATAVATEASAGNLAKHKNSNHNSQQLTASNPPAAASKLPVASC